MKTLLVVFGLMALSGCKSMCIDSCNRSAFHCDAGDKDCYVAVQKCFDACKDSPIISFGSK